MKKLFFPVDKEQFIGGAVQQLAKGFDALQLDGGGLIIDHAAEVLVTHAQLLVEPVFCFALLFQQGKDVQCHHGALPHTNSAS